MNAQVIRVGDRDLNICAKCDAVFAPDDKNQSLCDDCKKK